MRVIVVRGELFPRLRVGEYWRATDLPKIATCDDFPEILIARIKKPRTVVPMPGAPNFGRTPRLLP